MRYIFVSDLFRGFKKFKKKIIKVKAVCRRSTAVASHGSRSRTRCHDALGDKPYRRSRPEILLSFGVVGIVYTYVATHASADID